MLVDKCLLFQFELSVKLYLKVGLFGTEVRLVIKFLDFFILLLARIIELHLVLNLSLVLREIFALNGFLRFHYEVMLNLTNFKVLLLLVLQVNDTLHLLLESLQGLIRNILDALTVLIATFHLGEVVYLEWSVGLHESRVSFAMIVLRYDFTIKG